jgi:hypothetical protein
LTLVMTTAATHPMGLARAPTARASVIIILFHVSVTSSSIVIEMAGQAACRRPCAFCNISKRQLPLLQALDAVNVRRRCFWGWLRFAMAGFPPGTAHGQPRLPALTLVGSGRLSNSFFNTPGLHPCCSSNSLN